MSTITTTNSSDAISSSRAVINTNFSNLNTDKIETSVIDTDTALTANSDAKIPSQKAVKAYVDAGGNVNASETTKGIVEEATDAEVTAGTATGATGAKLFVSPAKLATKLAAVANVTDLDTTDTSLLNSTTETIVYTKVITNFTTTSLLKLAGTYDVVWEKTGGPQVTVRIKLNGTTAASVTLTQTPPGGSSTAKTYTGRWFGYVLNNASLSSQKSAMSAASISDILDTDTTGYKIGYASNSDATSAVDTSGSCTVTVTYQSSNATASRGWNHYAVELEKIG